MKYIQKQYQNEFSPYKKLKNIPRAFELLKIKNRDKNPRTWLE